ncbi:EI24 domain-containing protein [Phanerochaete sordida]|uniref:EI24 domain-containing protein n=1 Tax=Phanerochaete sordida TaxID=48140 RepID=A0A9P3GFS9_9APHY|nr:EI24 domain-containing protein [Phanerochaete sordida]
MSDVQLPGDFGAGSAPSKLPYSDNVPENLRAATARLQFPPSYVIVGVYRLFTDKNLIRPAWDKCKHGVVRGAGIALAWAVLTFKIQRKFVEVFLIKSPSVTGLSRDAVFGIHLPFDLPTYATLMFISTQATAILTFFLSKNIRIARDRVYEQTIISRGKTSEFWGPYVEEWDHPPKPSTSIFTRFAGSVFGRIVIKMALAPLHLLPVVGIVISAWLRALGTGRHLHRTYFKAKRMTEDQVSVFVEERKWDYRAFGFAAALLEGLPIIGLVFTVSNRIGAAMWAHDLEKRQHYVAQIKGQQGAGKKE